MLKKIIRKIKLLFYSLPFAMKAGDEMIMTSSSDSDGGTELHEKKVSHSVWQDLLEGNITKAVEELRYTMYLAEEKSNEYKYLGNGVAVKREQKPNAKKFRMQNIELEYNVEESWNMVQNGGKSVIDKIPERRIVEVDYGTDIPRFRLENHFEMINVSVVDDDKFIEFWFDDSLGNFKHKPVIKELRRTIDDFVNVKNMKSFVESHELCNPIKAVSFSTFLATNHVPNGIHYKLNDLTFNNICKDEKKHIIILKFDVSSYDDGKLLSEKFYSESQAKKYENKEKKKDYAPVIDMGGILEHLNEKQDGNENKDGNCGGRHS